MKRARRLRDRRAEMFRETQKAGGRPHAGLLTGLLECGVCGSRQFTRRLHHQGGGPGRHMYYCNGAAKDQPELPEGVAPYHLGRTSAKVDEYVVEWLLAFVLEHRDRILGGDGSARLEAVTRWEAARDGAEAALAELQRLYEADELSLESWHLGRRKHEKRRDQAVLELDKLGASPFEALAPLAGARNLEEARATWNRIGDPEGRDRADGLEDQRALLRLVIDRVVLMPTRRRAAPAGERPEHVPEGEKWCRACGGTWPLDDFYPEKASPDGLMARCRTCVSKAAAERYQARKQGPPAPAPDNIRIIPKLLGADSAGQASATPHEPRGAQ